MTSRLALQRGDVRLACQDLGGSGRDAVLLHGLAGHAGEWKSTSEWLSAGYRVLAPDARSHGCSERHPANVSRPAHIEDVTYLIEQLATPPVTLIGQSLGGHTALLVAARRPDLIGALVLADAGPAGAGSKDAAERAADELGRSLTLWPVPFPDRDAAIAYFGGSSLHAEAWADGLVQEGQGWWAAFDVPVMIETLRQAIGRSYWEEWKSIQCPTLVVRAEYGVIDMSEMKMMSECLPHAELVQLPGAKHDLHLDQPEQWREVVESFLR